MLQEGRRRDYVMKQKLLPPLGMKGQMEVELRESRESSMGEGCS